ncbi:CaiB/BaiF CoA transferase family protein [Halogranum amylolyticum]|uniref:CaiB/BaiF CoA transferase family protein n=1 Tax=Halogranum amylolyticum TaxID=660520 RepID=UPI001FCDE17C|nr:CaiB/BaiF CoA-transferase family protein [Halogranum amylolyticum]
MNSRDYILEGVRVVDLSTFVTGGFCSLMLANQGADVIKVERPDVGDDIRHSGPPFLDGESPYYWTVNYDKRSVELDLKSEAGTEALFDLVAEADVFVQNFRPGTAERLGVDYDAVTEACEDIVYCDISAFGATGPWRERPGYDLLVQGLSGIMSVTGEADGQPVKVGLPQTDLITGMWAAFGIVSALYRRERTGEGEYMDLGMLDATLPWLTKQAGKVFAGEETGRMGTKDPVLAPYQTFRTKDSHLNVACLNQKLWKEFCHAIDRPDLPEDERFETNADRVDAMDELEAEIESTLGERTTDEWMEVLVEAGVPAGPVQEVADALDNEQTEAREMVGTMEADGRELPVVEHPLKFRHAESGFRSPPPRLGEHTREVFRELGYSGQELDRLVGEADPAASTDGAETATAADTDED